MEAPIVELSVPVLKLIRDIHKNVKNAMVVHCRLLGEEYAFDPGSELICPKLPRVCTSVIKVKCVFNISSKVQRSSFHVTASIPYQHSQFQ